MRRLLFPLFLTLSLLAACKRPAAPLVGISCAQSGPGTDRLSTNYSQAVLRAGGIPLIIPTLSSPEEAEQVLARLDGIIFSGGEDVNPAWYGEEILNETVGVNPGRDRSDSLLARAALRAGKPILAICRGEQLMNVILGGSLWQDIPAQLLQAHTHQGVPHKIGLDGESFLSRLYGPDSLQVNSHHHQAVKDPAPGIRVTARSDDGIVEAWENDQVWAVQFHPEALLREDDAWLPLFAAFVDRMRGQRPQRQETNLESINTQPLMNAIHTEKAPAAIGPYSQAVDSGAGLVFVSGQLPINPATGAFPEGGVQEQTRQSLTNAAAILESAGLSLKNVVKTTVFLADMADFAAMNEVYSEFFAAPFPARSAVAVKTLPKNALVEIECIAAR